MVHIRSGDGPVEIGGIRISAVGVDVQADVHTGPTARQRGASVTGRTSPIDAQLEAAGLVDRTAVEIDIASPAPGAPVPGTRGATVPSGVLRLDVPIEQGTGNLLLVEDDGFLRWILPSAPDADGPGADLARGAAAAAWSFDVPVDIAPASRGLIGAIGKRIIRVLAFKLIDPVLGKIGDHFVSEWEKKHRRYRLRTFTPRDYNRERGTELDDERLARMARTGRVLLVIHGTSSLTHSGFGLMHREDVAGLNDRYGGRVVAFDHPTLSVTPEANARWLAAKLPKHAGFEVDILCHSRGGLVARCLAERPAAVNLDPQTLRVGSVTFVGTPNSGTTLCDPGRLSELVDSFTNLVDLVPDNPVIDTLGGLIEMLKQLALGAYKGLDGVMSMDPKGSFLRTLNQGVQTAARYFAVAADYEPAGKTRLADVRNLIADRIFGVANDLIVPTESVWFENGSPMFPIAERLVLPREESVDHSSYWLAKPVRDAFAQWLPPSVEPPAGPRAIAPSASRARRLGASGDGKPPRHVLKVRVLHASLAAAKYPVLVGHYEGAPLAGAEAFVDARLDGRLTRRQVAGLYPEVIGDVLVLNGDDQAQGVIVVGLGHRGELSPSNLAKSVTKAVLTYALDLDDQSSDRRHGLSTVLIGSNGADGLLIKQSVFAILEGAATAFRTLAEQRPDRALPIDEIEIVEAYARRAHRAAHAIEEIERHLPQSLLEFVSIEGAGHVDQGDGNRPGDLPYEYDRGSWRRVAVTSTDIDDHTVELDFTSFGLRARADRLTQVVDRVLLQRLLKDAMEESLDSPEQINRALFEMLFPADLKHDLAAIDRLHLVVDERAADFPWELLADRNAPGESEALAVRTGMLRQLQLAERRQVERGLAAELTAIVVGNPPGGSSFPQLPGAVDEAERVTKAFTDRSFAVAEFIWRDKDPNPPSSSALTTALLSEDFRIVHIAAHGHFETPASGGMPRGGVVIDDGVYLTASTIGQMRRPPDVVFLNCCHLAQIGAIAEPGKRTFVGREPNVLAASLARELMRCGVRAVIAAGWPVIDRAAARFAESFYEDMLEGAALGDAVSRARRDAFKTFGGGNTWASYQCYGDPAFRLATPGRSAPSRIRPVGPVELIRVLADLSIDASDPDVEVGPLLEQLGSLEDHLEEHPTWRSRGDVLAAFGEAYGAVQLYDAAISWYRKALRAEKHLSTLETVEQLALLLARRAVARRDAGGVAVTSEENEEIEALFREAEALVETLMRLGETARRRALLGSVYKKWAAVSQRRELMERAIEHYLAADLPYCRLNALQLSAVTGIDVPEATKNWFKTFEPGSGRDFWDRVTPADAALTAALLEDTADVDVRTVVRRYREVFRSGRVTRELEGTIAHLDDLAAVAMESKRPTIEQIRDELREPSMARETAVTV